MPPGRYCGEAINQDDICSAYYYECGGDGIVVTPVTPVPGNGAFVCYDGGIIIRYDDMRCYPNGPTPSNSAAPSRSPSGSASRSAARTPTPSPTKPKTNICPDNTPELQVVCVARQGYSDVPCDSDFPYHFAVEPVPMDTCSGAFAFCAGGIDYAPMQTAPGTLCLNGQIVHASDDRCSCGGAPSPSPSGSRIPSRPPTPSVSPSPSRAAATASASGSKPASVSSSPVRSPYPSPSRSPIARSPSASPSAPAQCCNGPICCTSNCATTFYVCAGGSAYPPMDTAPGTVCYDDGNGGQLIHANDARCAPPTPCSPHENSITCVPDEPWTWGNANYDPAKCSSGYTTCVDGQFCPPKPCSGILCVLGLNKLVSSDSPLCQRDGHDTCPCVAMDVRADGLPSFASSAAGGTAPIREHLATLLSDATGLTFTVDDISANPILDHSSLPSGSGSSSSSSGAGRRAASTTEEQFTHMAVSRNLLASSYNVYAPGMSSTGSSSSGSGVFSAGSDGWLPATAPLNGVPVVDLTAAVGSTGIGSSGLSISISLPTEPSTGRRLSGASADAVSAALTALLTPDAATGASALTASLSDAGVPYAVSAVTAPVYVAPAPSTNGGGTVSGSSTNSDGSGSSDSSNNNSLVFGAAIAGAAAAVVIAAAVIVVVRRRRSNGRATAARSTSESPVAGNAAAPPSSGRRQTAAALPAAAAAVASLRSPTAVNDAEGDIDEVTFHGAPAVAAAPAAADVAGRHSTGSRGRGSERKSSSRHSAGAGDATRQSRSRSRAGKDAHQSSSRRQAEDEEDGSVASAAAAAAAVALPGAVVCADLDEERAPVAVAAAGTRPGVTGGAGSGPSAAAGAKDRKSRKHRKGGKSGGNAMKSPASAGGEDRHDDAEDPEGATAVLRSPPGRMHRGGAAVTGSALAGAVARSGGVVVDGGVFTAGGKHSTSGRR